MIGISKCRYSFKNRYGFMVVNPIIMLSEIKLSSCDRDCDEMYEEKWVTKCYSIFGIVMS